MADRNKAIDELKLAETFPQTHKPFDECWSVRMDSELFVIDDDEHMLPDFRMILMMQDVR